MSSFDRIGAESILIVSARPVLRNALKRIIEEAGWTAVITASNERSAAHLVAEIAPTTIVIDHPDIGVEHLGYLFQHQDQAVNIVVIGWNDNRMVVYSRSAVHTATLGNLIELMTQYGSQ